jgi:hypothetical protein
MGRVMYTIVAELVTRNALTIEPHAMMDGASLQCNWQRRAPKHQVATYLSQSLKYPTLVSKSLIKSQKVP